MRKRHLVVASVSVALLSACAGSEQSAIDSDLKKDLELAFSSDGIALSNGAVTASPQFVSAIEQTSPPARKVATSARAKRHRSAPKAPPQVVEAEAPADVVEDVQSVATAPVALDADIPVSPRPQPVAVSYPSGSSSVGTGSATGAVLGTILGAVVRGGVVGDIDHCDPRRTGRRGPVIAINNRMPFPTGRVAMGGRRGNGDITSRFPH